MKKTLTSATKTQRATIEDLSVVGTELSDENLQVVSGGRIYCASYEAACCTVGNDTDWHRFD